MLRRRPQRRFRNRTLHNENEDSDSQDLSIDSHEGAGVRDPFVTGTPDHTVRLTLLSTLKLSTLIIMSFLPPALFDAWEWYDHLVFYSVTGGEELFGRRLLGHVESDQEFGCKCCRMRMLDDDLAEQICCNPSDRRVIDSETADGCTKRIISKIELDTERRGFSTIDLGDQDCTSSCNADYSDFIEYYRWIERIPWCVTLFILLLGFILIRNWRKESAQTSDHNDEESFRGGCLPYHPMSTPNDQHQSNVTSVC